MSSFYREIEETIRKPPDLFNKIAIGLTALGAITSGANVGSWTTLVFIVGITLLALPWLIRLSYTIRLTWKKRKAVVKYAGEFQRLVSQGIKYIGSNNEQSIPFFIRGYINDPKVRHLRPSDSVESLFDWYITRIGQRTGKKLSNYEEFEFANEDFYGCMANFSRIYIDELAEILNKNDSIVITPNQRAQLKERFHMFKGFLESYNAYREEIGRYWKTQPSYTISMPINTVE